MVSVEHLALCLVQFTVNPLLSPPGGLCISSPFGGGGLIETWGLLRDGVSLHFLRKSEQHRFFPKGNKKIKIIMETLFVFLNVQL